jgi:hypothetical protein
MFMRRAYTNTYNGKLNNFRSSFKKKINNFIFMCVYILQCILMFKYSEVLIIQVLKPTLPVSYPQKLRSCPDDDTQKDFKLCNC